MKKGDTIKDWYKIMEGSGMSSEKPREDKTFPRHHIKRNMMMALVAPTGGGKSTVLCEFLHRKDGQFHRIIIFSGSTGDEPLLNGLQQMIPGIEILDDPEELPNLEDEKPDRSVEKLIVFDDFINMSKKELKVIQKWANSARKYGYSCLFLAQNTTDIPMQLRRNIMVWLIFKLRDANTVRHLLKTTNVSNIPIEDLLQVYDHCTRGPKNFFKIDLTEEGKHRYSHNFIDFIEF